MTIETVEKVSKLLETKSEHVKDLSRLMSKDCGFHLCIKMRTTFSPFPFELYVDRNKDFNSEIKEVIIKKVEEEISRIDREIEQLKCE